MEWRGRIGRNLLNLDRLGGKKLERAGFEIEKIYGMPFYFGAGGRWKAIVVLGNILRQPSSNTFFVRP